MTEKLNKKKSHTWRTKTTSHIERRGCDVRLVDIRGIMEVRRRNVRNENGESALIESTRWDVKKIRDDPRVCPPLE